MHVCFEEYCSCVAMVSTKPHPKMGKAKAAVVWSSYCGYPSLGKCTTINMLKDSPLLASILVLHLSEVCTQVKLSGCATIWAFVLWKHFRNYPGIWGPHCRDKWVTDICPQMSQLLRNWANRGDSQWQFLEMSQYREKCSQKKSQILFNSLFC